MTDPRHILNGYIDSIVSRLPDDLVDMAEELKVVVMYPDIEGWGIAKQTDLWAFLKDVGLPKDCPTMISFSSTHEDIGEYIHIGYNNYGDRVCIAKKSGKLVYLIHDDDDLEVIINSSPLSFLLSVAAYRKDDVPLTLLNIAKFDEEASREGGWWHNESI